MNITRALTSGAVGALTVTALNEGIRRIYPHAPRMEVIGMRAVAAALRGVDINPPTSSTLYYVTLVGDLLGNTLYYSLAGNGRQSSWSRGIGLGLAAGIGGAFLPQPLGLGSQPRQRFPITHLLTIAWYLAGGIAATAAARRT